MAPPARTFDMLFPTVVQMTMVEDHAALDEELLAEIEAVRAVTPNGRPPTWSCDVYTTITNGFRLHERPAFSRLSRLFVENAERFGRTLEFPMHTHRPEIDMCWVNAYRRGQSQERHTHVNYVFSAIYYVKAPPGASKLVVHSPAVDAMVAPPVTEPTDLNTRYQEIEPVPGLMVVFRGTMRHAVRTGAIDAERVSIAMNAHLVARTGSPAGARA